jgi:hypothetical protein
MEHSEFVISWNQGRLNIDVDRSKAQQIVSSRILPKRYQVANMFWSWVCLLSIPAAFAVMFFYTWWAGLLLLVLLTPVLFISTKKAAMQFMIDHSVENPEFYQFAVSEGILRIRQKT